jgi:hypothetical protein
MQGGLVSKAVYSVGTWDPEAQAYTPQIGVGPSINVDWRGLLRVMRNLRAAGYSAHRTRDERGDHEDNDWTVLVERTDGLTDAEVLEDWKR